jgi:alpha-1,2-mannosyltransferase
MRSQRNRILTTTLFGAFVVIVLLLTTVRPSPPVDLAVYLRAAKMFATGGGLYDNGWGGPLAVPLPYTYPPVWAGLLSPVGWLPWRIVSVAWTVLDIALLAWIVRLCFRRFLDRKGETRSVWLVVIVIAAALTTPIASVFWFGQLGIVLTAACLADVVPERTRLPRGVLVGFAAALKLTPGIFAVYWLATKRWRPALTAAATSIGLWLAAAIARPDLSRQFWTDVVFRNERVGDARFVSNQSVHGWLVRSGWSEPLLWAFLVGVLLFIGLGRARVAHTAGDELAAATIIGLTALLVSPVSWIHHGVWIVPAAGVVLGDGREMWRRVSAAGVLALFVLRLPDWVADGRIALGPFLTPLLENAYVLAYVLLLVFLPVRTPVRDPYPAAESSAPA